MKYYKNIYYDTRQSKIYLWDYDGNIILDEWAPFVFTKSIQETDIKSIYGDYTQRRNFNTYKEYKTFQKNNHVFENNVVPSIQYLTERFIDNDNIELPDLHICYLDIETPHKKGFPKPEHTPAPIILISVIDENKKVTVFGIGKYNKNNKDITYINCDTEYELLNVFFNWMHKEQFDVITGWNITPDSKMNKYGGFDIPYIIRRSIKIFGEKGSQHRKLSPIGIVRIWESNNTKKPVYNVDIAGISVIDYLGLYKWFSFHNLASFNLDYVANIELKKNKIDYSSKYDTLWDFYNNDWNGFIDYCINDSTLVLELEEKCGYISLAQTLTCYCGCPMKNYNASVPLIEGLMLKYFRKNNLCAPELKKGKQVWFPAAYVKEPLIGMHKDVVDLDIASSYPTHIIILNMSLETYYGRIIGFKSKHKREYKSDTGIHEPLHEGRPIYDIIVNNVRRQEFPPFIMLTDEGYIEYKGKLLKSFNEALKRKLLCIAPNGAVFKNKPKGVIAKVEQDTYNERVKQKGLKSKYKNLIKEDPDNADKWEEMAQNRHVLQWAIKILINSVFGVMGVPYSRYNNVHMAEAITSSGRHTIKQCEVFVDDLLNNPNEDLLNILNKIREKIKEITNE